ncbi:glutaredoxin domain-containing protein [Clostridiaceae bacterium 35-E11]
MKEYLSQKGVQFDEIDVASDPAGRKELMQNRIMGVPVVKVNGEYIVGFDKEKLDAVFP